VSASGLSGRVAVVTGAASGLGRGSALRLAAEGCSVIAVDIDEAGLQTLGQDRGEAHGEILGVAADVSDPAQVDAYIAAGVKRFGQIDLHHLNAGIFGTFAPLPDLDVEEFDRVQAVNVRGQFLGLRGAFRRYREQRSAGAIVLTASIASLTGSADLIAYQTSKHATVGLVRGAAMFGGPLGIRVNAVAPGIVPTELFAAAANQSGGKDDMTRRASTTPLRRAGTPQDIAGVTAFLLSDDAAYVTGQIVSADGGATIVNTVRPSGGAGAWPTDELDLAMYGQWLQQEEVSREQ
jgi:NAD(P)-dependent dehydrogenase (short-subunit alcohol dehydrogenase family)